MVHPLTQANGQQAKKPDREAAPLESHLMLFSSPGVTPTVKTAAQETGCQLKTFNELPRYLERLAARRIR